MDEIPSAILSWEKVLEIDPGNAGALDFLQSADWSTKPCAPRHDTMASASTALLQEAGVLMHQAEFGAAFDLLRSASGPGFSGLEFEATLDLVRSCLHRGYREHFKDLERIPRLTGDSEDVTQLDLPSDAGFFLSMIDGSTSLADVISLSGMDALEALHNLNALLDAGVVELPA
jgi:hypothetical protein